MLEELCTKQNVTMNKIKQQNS